MVKVIEKGDHVTWYWGKILAHGIVAEVYMNTFVSVPGDFFIGGKEMPGANALLIKLDDGRKVFKLDTEVLFEPQRKMA